MMELIDDSIQQLEADAHDRRHLPPRHAGRVPTQSSAPRASLPAARPLPQPRSEAAVPPLVTHWTRILFCDLFHPEATEALRDQLAASDAASSARPISSQLYLDAHANRSFTLSAIVVAMLHAVWVFARRAYVRHKQQRRAARTYQAMSRLDDHTLRDLGYDRSELRSIAVHGRRR